MPRKAETISDIPLPPLPRSLLDPADEQYEKPVLLKPEDIRAGIQLRAGIAMDVLEWHARNIGDPKSSITACAELMDRAGYVAPAKGKADGPFTVGSGEPIPSVEEDVRGLSESFQKLDIAGGSR